MTFAEDLKKIRLKFNISQSACAKHLEISRRTLQYWESGKESHVPHILMQEGAMERMQDYEAWNAYEHLFGSKRDNLLTKSTKSADSAPVT
jgi:transcriptional regulator with XRE-family HTH domain